jgi:hypothetical protein
MLLAGRIQDLHAKANLRCNQEYWSFGVLIRQQSGEVDEIVRKAVAAGGTTCNEPQDYGFMYGHGFQDLDGHIGELAFMEPSAIKTQAWGPKPSSGGSGPGICFGRNDNLVGICQNWQPLVIPFVEDETRFPRLMEFLDEIGIK